jgi:hypothetical protein
MRIKQKWKRKLINIPWLIQNTLIIETNICVTALYKHKFRAELKKVIFVLYCLVLFQISD